MQNLKKKNKDCRPGHCHSSMSECEINMKMLPKYKGKKWRNDSKTAMVYIKTAL